MRRLLIIIESPALLPALPEEYAVTWCCRGEDAAGLLRQGFDALVLDLFLPGVDGLFLLQQLQEDLPPVVLLLTRFLSPYICQAAQSLGAGYVLRFPFTGAEFLRRLEDMFLKFETPAPELAAANARYHLKRLGICTGKGYRRMLAILPRFDPDAGHCLFSDCYPDLAKAESVSAYAIDDSIHRVIVQAYKVRNDALWQDYFPDTATCPTNKEFLTAIADRIRQKQAPL